MRIAFIFFFGLLIICSATANPFSTTCQILNADLSLNFFTKSSLFTDSLWYATIAPAYRINYQYNLINENKELQKFAIRTDFFFSNNFNLNSLVLEKGEVNSTFIALEFEYLKYVTVISPVSFIVGCTAAPKYSYYGQKISVDKAVEINEFFINMGPVCGFSYYKADFLEFSSLLGVNLGFPVYGEMINPNGDRERANYLALNGALRNRIDLIFHKFRIGLAYDFCLDFNSNSEIITHSLSMLCGVIF